MHPRLLRQVNQAKRYLNAYRPDELMPVDLIMVSMRPQFIQTFAQYINSQTVPIQVISIVTQGYSAEQIAELKDSITHCATLVVTEQNDLTVSVGERHNIAMQFTQSDYIANFDDDDVYYPHYLQSQLAYLKLDQSDVVIKHDVVAQDVQTQAVGWLTLQYRHQQIGAGGTLVFKRSLYDAVGGFRPVRSGYDSQFIHATQHLNLKVSSSDSFNFLLNRNVSTGHTWQPAFPTFMYLNDVAQADLALKGDAQ